MLYTKAATVQHNSYHGHQISPSITTSTTAFPSPPPPQPPHPKLLHQSLFPSPSSSPPQPDCYHLPSASHPRSDSGGQPFLGEGRKERGDCRKILRDISLVACGWEQCDDTYSLTSENFGSTSQAGNAISYIGCPYESITYET